MLHQHAMRELSSRRCAATASAFVHIALHCPHISAMSHQRFCPLGWAAQVPPRTYTSIIPRYASIIKQVLASIIIAPEVLPGGGLYRSAPEQHRRGAARALACNCSTQCAIAARNVRLQHAMCDCSTPCAIAARNVRLRHAMCDCSRRTLIAHCCVCTPKSRTELANPNLLKQYVCVRIVRPRARRAQNASAQRRRRANASAQTRKRVSAPV
jgi:hypothetical protein